MPAEVDLRPGSEPPEFEGPVFDGQHERGLREVVLGGDRERIDDAIHDDLRHVEPAQLLQDPLPVGDFVRLIEHPHRGRVRNRPVGHHDEHVPVFAALGPVHGNGVA